MQTASTKLLYHIYNVVNEARKYAINAFIAWCAEVKSSVYTNNYACQYLIRRIYLLVLGFDHR